MTPGPALRRWLAATATLSVFGGACATPGRPPSARAPSHAWSPAATEEDVLRAACARAGAVSTVIAEAHIRGAALIPGMTLVADIAVARPAMLYVAVRSPLGPPTDEVWTDGERYLWRSLRPGAGGAGRATPEELGRLLPVGVSPSQFVGLVTGFPVPAEPPRALAPCPRNAAVVPSARCIHLDYAGGRALEAWVDADGVVRRAELDVPEGRFSVEYEAGTTVPARVLLRRLGVNPQVLDITLRDVEVNRPLPRPLFEPLWEPRP